MHVRLGVALTVGLVVLGVMPAVAPAASVFTREMDIFDPGQRWIVYEAAAGEANRLVVENLDEEDPLSQARLVDAGAPLTVLPECVAHVGPVALCPSGPAQIELGDRNDVARITAFLPPAIQLTAGDGDDEVFAETSQPNVSGGAGNDRIRLGDSFFPGSADGGSGRDVIDGGPHGRALFGGPGDDLILHQSTTNFVNVSGDEGNDVLRLRYFSPSHDPNGAGGGPGDDVLFVARADVPVDPDPPFYVFSWGLVGGDGRDVLIGGASRDALLGEAGNDVLIARDGNPDVVSCGDGFDIAYADAEDTLSNCEITLSLSLARVARMRDALERVSNARATTPRAPSARAQSALRQFARGAKIAGAMDDTGLEPAGARTTICRISAARPSCASGRRTAAARGPTSRPRSPRGFRRIRVSVRSSSAFTWSPTRRIRTRSTPSGSTR